MATKPADEEAPPAETLKYKTWVLKVLIHCDGCKKTVKKVLQGIDGVYTTEVDPWQHKVTVTGDVEAETLIKKLHRSGKLAELWPEKPAEKKDKKKIEKSKGGGDGNKGKENNQKNNEQPIGDCTAPNENCEVDAAGEESDKEEDHGDGDECEQGGGGGDEDGKKKKKKKKKKKNKGENGGGGSAPLPNNNEGGGDKANSTIDAQVKTSSLATPSANFSKDLIGPPIQHDAYPYPPQLYYSPPPPPPAYGLSYNTAYPNISTASYYVGAPIMPMHAYYTNAYSGLPLPPPPPPSDPINHHYVVDDEHEYEGGCTIM